MIREFILHGLNCANCAAKIERSVSELEGVSNVSVNHLTAMLRLDVVDYRLSDVYTDIERIVHQHEPDVSVVEKEGYGRVETGKENVAPHRLIWLIAGSILFVVGMVLEQFFDINRYILYGLFILGYILLGGKVVSRAVVNIIRGKAFDESFLMAVATIGAFAIGDHAEAVGVMLFYQIGEFLQDVAVQKSKKTISRLLDIRPDYANLLVEGEITKVTPESVCVGDVIVVKPGERIPLDGIVTEGEAMLDTAALTGEAVPCRASASDKVLSGCINLNGVITIEVTQTYGQSTASKIIDLVENAAGKKAPTESFITKFARYYTPFVVSLALFIAVLPPLAFGGTWSDWINRGLIFLVISCPCALVISIPVGFFGGIGGASKKGILVKGGNYLEALNNLDIVVFDKTGTLTKGVFNVSAVYPAAGYSANEVLEAAANAEAFSSHPIALSIIGEYGKAVNKNSLTEYKEIAGHGVSVKANGKTIYAGNDKLMDREGVKAVDLGTGVARMEDIKIGAARMEDVQIGAARMEDIQTGAARREDIQTGAARMEDVQIGAGRLDAQTCAERLEIQTTVAKTGEKNIGTEVYVAVDDRLIGCIVISDEVKEDSYRAVVELKKLGAGKTVMLTGDNPEISTTIAKKLRIDEVWSGLLPWEKVEKVELLNTQKRAHGKLVFVGDGINDAPVLAIADIGVAMGGLGSDAAIEAADIVLMTDEPTKLTEAVEVARFTKRVVWQNIIFALGVKSLFLLLGAIGVAAMWEAVFADVGVALLAVLNSMRVMKRYS